MILYVLVYQKGRSYQGELGWHGMWHAGERRVKCERFGWESLKEREHLED
jgi:hypothetical protein